MAVEPLLSLPLWVYEPATVLVNAFGGRYLKWGSWSARDGFIDHVSTSWPEYNELYAHPFEWTWTNNQMRNWFAKHD